MPRQVLSGRPSRESTNQRRALSPLGDARNGGREAPVFCGNVGAPRLRQRAAGSHTDGSRGLAPSRGQARLRRISEERMSFNPLRERGIPIEKQFRDWSELNVKPYDKMQVHPFSRCRGIVINAMGGEAVMFSHNRARHTVDPKIK